MQKMNEHDLMNLVVDFYVREINFRNKVFGNARRFCVKFSTLHLVNVRM